MRTKEFRPLFLAVEWHTVTSASTGKTLSQSCIANSTYEYRSTQQSGEWLRKTTATLIHLASPRSFSAVRDSRTSTIRVCVCVCPCVCACVCVCARLQMHWKIRPFYIIGVSYLAFSINEYIFQSICEWRVKIVAWYQPIFVLDFILSQPCWRS